MVSMQQDHGIIAPELAAAHTLAHSLQHAGMAGMAQVPPGAMSALSQQIVPPASMGLHGPHHPQQPQQM